ncbi:diacylglycerol kinase [Cupriavidus necator H16]|uniref:Diacylglycerol kinase n=1 Tax=Cupriavidus necator (strain ATCC 17699 / DSM 428 / KCTC 22496 / NCIMB 10442 / H16 / Stanier 337) TaxID=381666 RepID=Q0KCV2_CUPNH|nr:MULTISPECIES: diacylglycerol kinase [Cupriavidus]EON21766.1 diacylglycerol kinase [Cupriavidus sp. GA3-3]QCC00079.1 diacylglycerol kinase [Cupriavidus necator H16]QQB77107.1 diacylglycerol kinase [Cupriavidus necator]WKA41932.1 diacylglycerol kinase [Cupriavidus necator]CAJ92169.1 diacylglycerol kinase [Cupriavidus necator H16]
MPKPHPELPSDPPLQRPPQAVQSADYSIEQNPHKANRGLTRAWHAAINSLSGLRYAVLEESAFRQELTLVAILAPWAFLLPVDVVERILLLGTLLVVLIVELLNSSVEAAIDRISLERHSLSKRAKDFGSAAVMLALVLCGGTWVAIAGPHVVRWVRTLAG